MARIQTTIRLIEVKESVSDISRWVLEGYEWIALTEDTSFYGELTGTMHNSERKITLNRGCILEIYE